MLTAKELMPSAEKDFLSEGGVMGELICKFDWANTSLGPIESWTGTLKNAIRLCLTASFPALIYCGPKLLVMYNDAFIKLAGRKHPEGMLGLPLSETRKEVWPVIAPFITTAYEKNKIVRVEDLFLPLDLEGFLEEYYFTLAYIPMGAPGKVDAIFANVYNITAKIIQARQLSTLKEIELRIAEAKTVKQVCFTVLKTLSTCNNKDVPFALLYMIDAENNVAKLQCEPELIKSELAISPSTISLKESVEAKPIWPLRELVKAHKYEVVDISKIPAVPSGYWEEPPRNAILIPIRMPGKPSPVAIFIAGVSPRRRLDEDYIRFFNAISGLLVAAITNAEAYENEQQRLQSLAEIDRAKIAFFGTVSHELRTPLTLVLGPLEQMLTDTRFTLAHEQIALLQMMLRNTRRLLKLVNNILDYSRIEAHRLQGEFEPINIAEYTNYLASFFRPAIEKAGLKFAVDIKPIDEPLYVDRSMWEKMIFNILSNAFKYTFKGTIAIALKKLDHHVELDISDTGIGIADKDLPHIFERFYHVIGVHGRGQEGTGIGLSLAQELAKLHGSRIQVISELGKGSTFSIIVPLGKDHLPASQIKAATIAEPPELRASAFVDEVVSWLPVGAEKPLISEPPISLKPAEPAVSIVPEEKKVKILIIDENVDMRIYLRSLLIPYWVVIEAVNSEAGIEAAKTQIPDLILCDVVMGKMGGLELIKILRSESKTRLTPIILVSASISEEDHAKGLESGADDYLDKPFSAKELVARIRTQLELGKVRIELQTTIEELKKANASLIKSKESYRVLANMSPVGIMHLDAEGVPTYSNPKGFSILGLPLDTSCHDLNIVWRDALHPEDRERIVTLWGNVVRYQQDHYKAEYRFVHKDKSVVWVIGEAISERDASGNLLGYIFTLTDVTRLKELLDRQVRVVDSLCHELRNPLSGIHGNITLLLSNLLSLKTSIQQLDETYKIDAGVNKELLSYIAESEESVEAMKRCTQHLKVVTNDVLDLSKLEAGKVELHEKSFDPNKIIQDALTMVNFDIKRKEQKVEMHHSILDFSIVSDPDRIKQVILNLLTNSIKFTPNRGGITIGYQAEEETAEQCILKFFVEDTGIGISEEGKVKLFNRFAQAEQRTFAEYGGSGLGLSICKQLVELMGGQINVASTLGKGSRFTFTIKCKKLAKIIKAKKSLKEFRGLPTKAEIEMLQGLVVVIVEDNIINQKVLERMLKKYGMKCYVASNGQIAVDLVKSMKNEINVILMDIEMPVMNGLDATIEIRRYEEEKSLRPIHIIGISGNVRPEYKKDALRVGMDAYFTKPYEIEEIVGEIKQKIKSIRSPVAPSRGSPALESASAAFSKTEKKSKEKESVQAVAAPVQEQPKDKVSPLRL